MYNNAVLPVPHHPPNAFSTSDSLPAHSGSRSGEPGLEAGTLFGPIDSLLDANCPNQDPHPPNALTVSTDWEFVSDWIPGAISPSPQEAPGGTGVSATYPTYSVGPTILYHLHIFIPHLRTSSLTATYSLPPTNSYSRQWVDPHFIPLGRRSTRRDITVHLVHSKKWNVNQFQK